MFPAECQAEEHNHPDPRVRDELEGERLSRRVSIREEARPRTS